MLCKCQHQKLTAYFRFHCQVNPNLKIKDRSDIESSTGFTLETYTSPTHNRHSIMKLTPSTIIDVSVYTVWLPGITFMCGRVVQGKININMLTIKFVFLTQRHTVYIEIIPECNITRCIHGVCLYYIHTVN